MPRQYEGMRKTFKWNLNDEEAGKTYPHLRHVYDKVRIAKLYKSKIPYGDINTIPKNFPNTSSVMLIGEENNNFIVPNWRSSANSLIVNKGDITRIIYAANPYMVDTTLLVRPEATESGCKYVINGM